MNNAIDSLPFTETYVHTLATTLVFSQLRSLPLYHTESPLVCWLAAFVLSDVRSAVWSDSQATSDSPLFPAWTVFVGPFI